MKIQSYQDMPVTDEVDEALLTSLAGEADKLNT